MSGILVIAEHRQGQLRPVTLEVVAAAKKLKHANGQPIAVAVIAAEPDAFVPALSVDGVDEIVTLKTAAADFDPHALQAAVKALLDARTPSVILMAHSVDSWAVAPAVAAETGIGFATDVFDLAIDGGELVATRAGYKEKVFVELDFPGKQTVLLTIRSNVFKPAEGAAAADRHRLRGPRDAGHHHPSRLEGAGQRRRHRHSGVRIHPVDRARCRRRGQCRAVPRAGGHAGRDARLLPADRRQWLAAQGPPGRPVGQARGELQALCRDGHLGLGAAPMGHEARRDHHRGQQGPGRLDLPGRQIRRRGRHVRDRGGAEGPGRRVRFSRGPRPASARPAAP